jgi:predicted TPR repeat methyltransferase
MNDTLEQARQQFAAGNAHFEADQFAQAKHCFETALGLAPGRPSLLTNLGATYCKLGQPQQALPLLQKALIGEPDNVQAWSYLAEVHAAAGNHALALPCFDRALELGLLPSAVQAALWLQRGESLVRMDRHSQARDSFDRAIAVAPAASQVLADAWSHKGTLLREHGKLQAAAECFEQALAAGADPEVHQFFLAAVRGAGSGGTAPAAYVAQLFDSYAEEFDTHLLQSLRYEGHTRLIAHLAVLAGLGLAASRFAAVLDLGCGTGLCAPLLVPLLQAGGRLDGVDLSAAMLAEASKRGLYAELAQADIAAHLQATQQHYDLLLAADVVGYIGDLAPVFAAANRVLLSGGLFCFTAERAETASEPGGVKLTPHLRFQHSEDYLRRLAAQHGFEVLAAFEAPLRQEQQKYVASLYVYLSKIAI